MTGPCAKRRTVCEIYTRDGQVFVGENSCENPQAACPRTAGEGYEKCQSICRQSGHAEIEALSAARAANANLSDAHAHLMGHYYICEPCGRALREAGVSDLTIYYGDFA